MKKLIVRNTLKYFSGLKFSILPENVSELQKSSIKKTEYGLWLSDFYSFGALNEAYSKVFKSVIEDKPFKKQEEKINDIVHQEVINMLPKEIQNEFAGRKLEIEYKTNRNGTIKSTSICPGEENSPITSIIHRYGEKGIFIFFSDLDVFQIVKEEIINKKKFCGRKVNVFPVLGNPYINDIFTRVNSPKITIVIDSESVEQDLYPLFRKFGQIYDMNYDKTTKTLTVQYVKKRFAINATNCLHRAPIPGSEKLIEIRVVPLKRFRKIIESCKSPKAFPFIMIFLTIMFLLLIDPFRLFNCIRTFYKPKKGEKNINNDLMKSVLESSVSKVQKFIERKHAHLIVLTGEKPGIKNEEIIKLSTDKRRFTTTIECNHPNLKEFICNFEKIIAFKPSFITVNRAIGYLQSIIHILPSGSKSNDQLMSSETQQLQKILNTLLASLRIMSPVTSTSIANKPIISFLDLDLILKQCKKEGEKLVKKELINFIRVVIEKDLAHVIITSDFVFINDEIKKKENELRDKLVHVKDDKLSEEQALNLLKNWKIETEIYKDHGLKGNVVGKKKVKFYKVFTKWWRYKRNKEFKVNQNDNTEHVNVFSEQNTENIKRFIQENGTNYEVLLSFIERFKNIQSIHTCGEQIYMDIKYDILKTGFGKSYFEEDPKFGWSKLSLYKAIKEISEKEVVLAESFLKTIFGGKRKQLRFLVEAGLFELIERNSKLYVRTPNKVYLKVYKDIAKDPYFSKNMKQLQYEKDLMWGGRMNELEKKAESTRCSIM